MYSPFYSTAKLLADKCWLFSAQTEGDTGYDYNDAYDDEYSDESGQISDLPKLSCRSTMRGTEDESSDF